MEQKIFNAILLKAADHGESDRLVRLLTASDGVITAVMKGVKKPKAKMKFGAMQFAFCEYTLVKGAGGFYTVTGCAQSGDFFSLSSSYDTYSAASLVLECADAATGALNCGAVFLLTLNCFKTMLYRKVTPVLAASLYMSALLKSSGFYAETAAKSNDITIVPELISALLCTDFDGLEAFEARMRGADKTGKADALIEKTFVNLRGLFEKSFMTKLKSADLIFSVP